MVVAVVVAVIVVVVVVLVILIRAVPTSFESCLYLLCIILVFMHTR